MKHLKLFDNFQNWINLTTAGDWDKKIKIILPEGTDESYIKRKLVNIVITNKLLTHDDIIKSIKPHTGLFDPIVTVPMSGDGFIGKNEWGKVKKISDKLIKKGAVKIQYWVDLKHPDTKYKGINITSKENIIDIILTQYENTYLKKYGRKI